MKSPNSSTSRRSSKPTFGRSIFRLPFNGKIVPSEARIGSLKSRNPPGPWRTVAMNPLIRLELSPDHRGSFATAPVASILAFVYVAVVVVVVEADGAAREAVRVPWTLDDRTIVPPESGV